MAATITIPQASPPESGFRPFSQRSQPFHAHGDNTKIDIRTAQCQLTSNVEGQFGTGRIISKVRSNCRDNHPPSASQRITLLLITPPLQFIRTMMVTVIFQPHPIPRPRHIQRHRYP